MVIFKLQLCTYIHTYLQGPDILVSFIHTYVEIVSNIRILFAWYKVKQSKLLLALQRRINLDDPAVHTK